MVCVCYDYRIMMGGWAGVCIGMGIRHEVRVQTWNGVLMGWAFAVFFLTSTSSDLGIYPPIPPYKAVSLGGRRMPGRVP
jgi:hypothetical protein